LTNPTNATQLLPPLGYPATPGIDKQLIQLSPPTSPPNPNADPINIYPRDLTDPMSPDRELSIARVAHLVGYQAG
jgi:hypothetical protein